jgi:hypothetical protein
MSRAQDWRIHELMGNDLTGFQYGWIGDSAYKETETGVEWKTIPPYSTTWEGAGMVMARLNELLKYRVRSQCTHNEASVWIEEYDFSGSFSPWWKTIGLGVEQNFPQALAKAFISAMEERDNG